MSTQPRAILYTRVSTDEQAESGTSLADQLQVTSAKAQALGAQVVAHFTDEGISGAFYESRPGIQAALRAIEEGRADLLIVTSVSRLSRDTEHQGAIRKRIARAGGRLLVCDLPLEDTPEGGLTLGIMGSFSEYERQVIRKRTVAGRRRRAEEGVQPCRSLHPYGYRIVTKKDVLSGCQPPEALGTYLIHEEEAQWVRRIFEHYEGGTSLRGVCRWLEETGVPPPKGAHWYYSAVRFILTNPAYHGAAAFGRQQRRTDEGRLSQGYRCPHYMTWQPAEQHITIPCPPLVSRETWDRCQERMTENQQLFGGRKDRRYLLSGLVRCPVCGHALRVVTRKGRDSSFLCRPSYCGAPTVHHGGTYRMPTLEKLTLRALQAVVEQPEVLARALEAYRQRTDHSAQEAELSRVEEELRALATRERAAVEAQITGIQAGASPSIYAGIFSELKTRRESLEKRKAELEARTPHLLEPEDLAAEVTHRLSRLTEALSTPEMPPAKRNQLLSTIVREIRPDGKQAVRVLLRSDAVTEQHVSMQ